MIGADFADVAYWLGSSLPSCATGFDSRLPLQFGCVRAPGAQDLPRERWALCAGSSRLWCSGRTGRCMHRFPRSGTAELENAPVAKLVDAPVSGTGFDGSSSLPWGTKNSQSLEEGRPTRETRLARTRGAHASVSVLLNVFCRPCSSAGSSIRLVSERSSVRFGPGAPFSTIDLIRSIAIPALLRSQQASVMRPS